MTNIVQFPRAQAELPVTDYEAPFIRAEEFDPRPITIQIVDNRPTPNPFFGILTFTICFVVAFALVTAIL